MAEMAEIYDALRKADAEGDTDSVAKLSAYINSQGPQETATPAPAPQQPLTFGQKFQQQARDDLAARKTAPVIGPVGQIEAGVNMMTGLGASAAGGLAGIVGSILPGPEGQGADWSQRIQHSGTYQPRSDAGKIAAQSVAAPMTVSTDVSTYLGGKLGSLMGNEAAGEFVGEVAPSIVGSLFGIKAPLKSIATTKYSGVGTVPLPSLTNARNSADRTTALVEKTPSNIAAKEAASSADWQRAAPIEAAKIAQENKIILNPSSVSGGGHTVKMATAGGSAHFNTAASIANKSKWNNMVREDLGVGANTPLNATTYNNVRKLLAKPYDEAATLGPLAPKADAIKAIRDIEIPEILPAGEQAAGKMKRITDTVADQLEGGMTGEYAVNTTRTLRKEAQSVFSSVRSGNQVDHVTIQTAKAKMAIAEKIDETISSNITDPQWKSAFDDSRRKMAQSYAYERATNLNTYQVDPQVFAQEMTGRHNLTGNAEKMGRIAGNYPEIANVYAEHGKTFGMPVRSGPAGTVGFAVGSLYGSPVATSAISAGVAAIGEKILGKRLRGESAQLKYATPVDRRIMPTPEPVPQRGLVPYISPTEVVDNVPNFTFKKQASQPKTTFVGEDTSALRIGMSEGPVGGQMGALRAEDARVRATSVRQGQAAEAAQAASEAAARKPASGGMMFDLDPSTGKLIPTSKVVESNTLQISTLESAIGKMKGDKIGDTGARGTTSGASRQGGARAFDLTAAEKVAYQKFDKLKLEIPSIAPEFSKLTDKQIMSKMADREWVQNTIDKAQQKVDMLARSKAMLSEQLANRSNYRMMASEIADKNKLIDKIQADHARMTSLVGQLQETLGGRPSSRGYGQGPVTRAFQRGLLTGNTP